MGSGYSPGERREGGTEERREGRRRERTEVGVHELHYGTIAVHSLPEGLADKVSFVDDLIRGPKFPECLLG